MRPSGARAPWATLWGCAAPPAEEPAHLDPERLEHPSQLRRSLLAERHERQDHQRHRRAAVAARVALEVNPEPLVHCRGPRPRHR